VASAIAPNVTKAIQGKLPPGTVTKTDIRSYVTTWGTIVAETYCMQAEAHYQLAEPAAGAAQAAQCATWLNRLIPYSENAHRKSDNAELRRAEDQLDAIRLVLESHYPTVTLH